MWNRCEILPAWWAEMWPQIWILESGGHKGWWISRIWNLFSFCLCHHLFCLTQLNLLLGESISRKKILNLFTTSKEFELRDFEGDFWLVIRLCKNWTYFQEEEKSLRTLAAKISLPMWSTQSDCGGDQHEIFSILDIFLQMSEMRSDEIVK